MLAPILHPASGAWILGKIKGRTAVPVSAAAHGSVRLDPATCLALKPIHDIGSQAMKERDGWNRWAVEIARMLNVACADFASDVVAEQYAELRARITQALNAEVSDRRSQDSQIPTRVPGGSEH